MTTHKEKTRSKAGPHKGASFARKAVSAGMAATVLGGALLSAPIAEAAIGGGSAGGGGGGGAGAYNYLLLTYDDASYLPNPPQGWGNDSINTFKQMLAGQNTYQPMQGLDLTNHFDSYIRTSCETALAQASARADTPGARSRVVQVGMTMYPGGVGGSWVPAWGGATQEFANWYNGIADAQNNGNLHGWDAIGRGLVKQTFNANIVAQPRAVCVAVNEFEPKLPPKDYALSVSTDKGATFAMAGSTSVANDVIHASNGGSTITENVAAKIHLHWNGPEGQKVVRSKDVGIRNNGDTRSPNFSPADFGWNSWPAGGFWFDVTVAKQGAMKAAVDTPDNDPRESWSVAAIPPTKILTHGGTTSNLVDTEVLSSGMFYDARITAHTNGYASSMTITDQIGTEKVFIGDKTKDVASAAYVLDPAGNRVGNAVIKVDRSVAGKVGVTGTVPNITVQGKYTLVVPTYVLPTKTDYTIPDTSHVCYTASQKACLNGNSKQTRKVTPAPDKVWVLDEKGGLVASDPGHSNGEGSDGQVFLPGDKVSAVVNGRVPAKLAENLTNYQLTDDWTKAAKYVDFSDASKAKVFYEGKDVTSQFDVKVNGTVTTATAKSEFLAKTKGLGADAPVKLIISGAFRTNYDTNEVPAVLYNNGSETWNNETMDTNEPPVFTVTMTPDKVWVLDEKGGLVESDADHSNQEGSDGQVFLPGDGVSAVVNGGIPANLAGNMSNYQLIDDWTKAAKYVDFSNVTKAKVFADGKDVTSLFDVKINGTVTTATAKPEFLSTTAGMKAHKKMKLIISGSFRTNYDTNEVPAVLYNNGSEIWNNEKKETNEPPVFTITMTPDKVWVLDENGGLTIGDPNWTNNQGADNMVFLPGDGVSAVVNGTIPGNLARNMSNYQLIDDWTKAAKYVDFSDVSKAKVFADGKDVTSQFDVKINGTVTTATAKAGFLSTTAGLKADKKLKLIISGSFRTDYVTKGEKVVLHNDGAEVWNDEKKATNEPPVYTWTPDPHKQVIGSGEESGDKTHSDINGMSVFPGQKLEYSIQLDMRIPANTARGVKTLAMEDAYDPQLAPDKSSVEFFDSRTNKPIARSAYKLTFDEANHSFRAEFTPEWIAANVNADGANSQWENGGWLLVRFTGTVKADTVGGSTVKNQAFQIINGVKTATEIPEVKIPSVKPDKEDLNTNLDNIDGKTVVKGDHILYRLTLDGGPSKDKLAYNVHKLGMVDDFDQDYLDLTVEGIKVASKSTGADVTDKFNIQIKDGVAYIFAKQVDSTNAYGELLAGDPQPADLAAYDAAAIAPNTTPIIDQDLLGQQYWITLDTVVSKEINDYTIKNQARQNIQNTNHMTKIVSNPLKDIDPSKDVVVDESTKDASLDGAEVKLYSTFNYRLNSSEIPANRAYGASQWSVSDSFDRVHDSYTGIWAVYANSDVYNGEELIFKKGDLLADSAGHQAEPYNGLFEVTFDEESYTLTASATLKYLDMVNTRGDLAQSFSVYTKMERIAPSEEVLNKVTEKYNNVDRESNIVKTNTPEHPAIDVEKFTLDEGLEKGDRDEIAQALSLSPEQLKDGTKVGFQIKNAGDVPLTNLTFADAVAEGTFGAVEDVVCEVPMDGATVAAVNAGSESKADTTTWIEAANLKDLALGQTINCQGTLTGMEPGMSHSDTVTVTGESVFTQKKVEDADSWHATAPEKPSITVEKYTLDEGLEKGDRDLFKDALVLTPEQAKKGLKIGFKITNNGDVPLKNVKLSDVTRDGTTGKVDGLVCADPALPEAPKPEATDAPSEGPTTTPSDSPTAASADGVSADAQAKLDAAAAAAQKAAAQKAAAVKAATGVQPSTTTVVVDDSASTAKPAESKVFDLGIGEFVDCTGTLTGVQAGTSHADLASVVGESKYTGQKVTADDPWNAVFPTPEVPKVKEPDTKWPGNFVPKKGAVTGMAVSEQNSLLIGGGIAAILAALAAGGAYWFRRTRNGRSVNDE